MDQKTVMGKINIMKLAIYLAAFVFLLNAFPAMAKSLPIGEVYKSFNGKHAIEIISNSELAIVRGGKTIHTGYSVDGDKLRVMLSDMKTKRIKYFKIIPEGLREVKMGVYILYSRDKYKMGLLRKAARAGDVATVKTLLAEGIDVNQKTGKGGTALMQAAKKGRTDIAKLLIAKGAEVNAKNKYGSTALMKAVDGGHPKTVKLLVDRGADVNAKNNKGASALKIAIKKGRKEIARILKNSGAKE